MFIIKYTISLFLHVPAFIFYLGCCVLSILFNDQYSFIGKNGKERNILIFSLLPLGVFAFKYRQRREGSKDRSEFKFLKGVEDIVCTLCGNKASLREKIVTDLSFCEKCDWEYEI